MIMVVYYLLHKLTVKHRLTMSGEIHVGQLALVRTLLNGTKNVCILR